MVFQQSPRPFTPRLGNWLLKQTPGLEGQLKMPMRITKEIQRTLVQALRTWSLPKLAKPRRNNSSMPNTRKTIQMNTSRQIDTIGSTSTLLVHTLTQGSTARRFGGSMSTSAYSQLGSSSLRPPSSSSDRDNAWEYCRYLRKQAETGGFCGRSLFKSNLAQLRA